MTGSGTVGQEVAAESEVGTRPSSADDGARSHGEAAPGASGLSTPRWLVRLAWVAFALQLAYLMIFSVLEYRRFALTADFAQFHQAWYLIGHGDLDPFSTGLGSWMFWRNDAEFLLWPLAVFGLPFNGNPLAMLWLQDLFVVGTGVVAFTWILDLTRRPSWPSGLSSTWVACTCLVLLVANPWVYWTAAYDFHMEVPGAFFLILTARSLERRRFRSCAVWAVLAILAGAVGAAMIAGLGIAAVLAGRKWRRMGLVLIGVGIGWTAVVYSLGLQGGGNLSATYGYIVRGTNNVGTHLSVDQLLFGVASHPQRVLAILWSKRLDIFANTAPSGLVGLLTPWGIGVPLVVLAVSNLPNSFLLSVPIFQDFPMYAFITVGTAYFLVRLTKWRSWGPTTAKLLCGLLLAVTLGWSLVWIPEAYPQWIRVSPAAASVLARVEAEIPPQAEVVASQGIEGRFSNRTRIYGIGFIRNIPVTSDPVYFIVTPYQGIEQATVSFQLGLLWFIAGTLHAQLVAHGGGVWAFRWDPPAGLHRITLSASPTVPGWAMSTADGTPILVGPVAQWHMASGPEPGYVVDQAYWREPPGRYVATVALASTGPATVEVWNADSGVLLARRSLTSTNGPTDVFVDADNSRNVSPYVYRGAGPFQIQPIPPPPGNQLEVRVFAPAGSDVSVYSVELLPKRSAPAASHLGE
jgi:Predicted membrane protein (DUF2079)